MYGPILSRPRGTEPICPKKISTEKNCYAITCKIALTDSPQPKIISKILDSGHFISMGRMNSVFFAFNRPKYQKCIFSFLNSSFFRKK